MLNCAKPHRLGLKLQLPYAGFTLHDFNPLVFTHRKFCGNE